MSPMDDQVIADVLIAWGVRASGPTTTPAAGTIHQTVLVPTEAGLVVLRGYRYADPAPIVREHTVIAYAQTRGLPAVAPLVRADGSTMLEHVGRWYALFPHAHGYQVAEGAVGVAEAAAMGYCLAGLHRALADLPDGLLAPRPLAVDRAWTLAEIERLMALAQQGAHPHDRVVLHCLAGQRAYVDSLPADAQVDLAGLAFQPIHGDYTETNLFFQHGAVSAIIDWDQAYRAPRAWEVVRTLHLALRFTPALAQAFLRAYQAVHPIPWEELDQAARAYGVLRAHDVWLYQWVYDRGDDRARRFLTDRGFVPLIPQWEALR